MAPKSAGLWLAAAMLCIAGEAGAQVAAVPPPAEQQTADCTAPVFATDQLVCSDPALRALDTELAARLADAPEPASRWIEPQWQWFRRRSRCAFAEDHAACAEAAYRERLSLLRPAEEGAKMLKAACKDPDVAAIAIDGDYALVFDLKGNIRGVATSSGGKTSWQPFLTAEWRGRRVILRTADGTSLTCRTNGT